MKTDHGGGESLGTIPFAFLPQQKLFCLRARLTEKNKKHVWQVILVHALQCTVMHCEQFVKKFFFADHIRMGMI